MRILLKRFPKYISYLLWSVVLFRLLCPITLEFGISLVPNLKPVFYEYRWEEKAVPAEWPGEPVATDTVDEAKKEPESAQAAPIKSHPDVTSAVTEISWQERFLLFGKYIWVSGIGILLLYSVISAVRIRRKVSIAIPLRENIYMTDEAVSPFVMGIFRPRIYLPGNLRQEEQEYIILHEKFHIRRMDHIVKPAAFAALCIHWFNPLVWIAFILSCKDMEMSCDEAVIKRFGEDIRADYSASLLALSAPRRVPGGIPVDFGEGDTKGRVRNLAAFRKTQKGVLGLCMLRQRGHRLLERGQDSMDLGNRLF
ncbi:M56 family metallopeptidase [Acetatifactor aquisgranensis]|uniref:M56 family metallopeptidase n=1 Tax=Acetatifactor aquisgranensis TaxID=2941233 RepID=UPI00203FFB40|nr:M56 family metallopeptidase [Acetatifactor aquisgranensis]